MAIRAAPRNGSQSTPSYAGSSTTRTSAQKPSSFSAVAASFHGGPCRVVAEMGANEEGFNAAWEVHDSMMHACRRGRRSDRVGLGQMWTRMWLRVIRAGHGPLSGNLSAGVLVLSLIHI